eukprot:CAMPEP_0197079954 /NCGR_PEP_ID=MMETSP1384-20130603/213888_1 /TAXON_ID=29189 /ORGANISM="Ammonia sp." /LENGTH=199 /DNA_ID=CAMNT_0042518835 /DNA_START=27 /DNA_END=626 /DNA_ORIENTATION=+
MSARKRRRVELGYGTGVIGSLFDEKGYGFIINHNEEYDDVFFHFSEYPEQKKIESGTEVSFETVVNDKTGKYKAQNIRILKKSKSSNVPTASYDGQKTVHRKGHSSSRGSHSHHGHHHHHSHNNHSSEPHALPATAASAASTNASANIAGTAIASAVTTDADRPKLGCFKLVKKDVTDRPMYVPVFPLKGIWKTRKQFV